MTSVQPFSTQSTSFSQKSKMAAIEMKRSNDLAFFFFVANFSDINFGDSNFHSFFFAGGKKYFPQCLEHCFQIGQAFTDFVNIFLSKSIFYFPVETG